MSEFNDAVQKLGSLLGPGAVVRVRDQNGEFRAVVNLIEGDYVIVTPVGVMSPLGYFRFHMDNVTPG